MSTIEDFIGKPLHEISDEELAEFVKTRRRDITAIVETDLDGTQTTRIGKRTSKKVLSPQEKAELEANL